jgi:hypothetical protein
LGLFPNITTEEQHLQTCEFADQKMKVGLLYLCKYDGDGQKNNEVWVRRKFMLLNQVAYIFRRPDTPLYADQWEASYDLSSSTVEPVSCSTPRGNPSFVLRLRGMRRLEEKKKKNRRVAKNVLVVGSNDFKMLENWLVSFRRCAREQKLEETNETDYVF